ncbi:hypothetical protein FGIG_02760 [Fasciola gigantica]|uniref:Uncharacterized protein n=1 Tax=Fasciola gigantica TaxID=46835 RepID=A0A504Z0N9_FASGI|nr:hypothetical protein FGIG_02760 [Fasciola gigantica]
MEYQRLEMSVTSLQTDHSSSVQDFSQHEHASECYRPQITSQLRDLESYRLETFRLNEENKARQCLLMEAQSARIEAEKNYRNCQIQLEEMTQLKDEQRRQIEALTEQLSHVIQERNWYKKSIIDARVEIAKDTCTELEFSPSKLAHDATGELREHLSQLEQRLDNFVPTMIEVRGLDQADIPSDQCVSVLSEPDSTLGDSLISGAPLSPSISTVASSANPSISFESASDIVPLAESEQPLGAGDIQMGSFYVPNLLHERSMLTTRLETMRTQLAALKTQWKESLATLDSQVAHLNQKISRDAEQYHRQHCADQTVIRRLKNEISSLRYDVERSREIIRTAKTQLAEQSAEIATKEANWLDRKILLESTVAGLKEHAEQIAQERTRTMQKLIKLEYQVNGLRSELKSTSDSLIKRQQELESSKRQVEKLNEQLTRVKMNRDENRSRLLSISNDATDRDSGNQISTSETGGSSQSLTTHPAEDQLQQKDRVIRVQRKRLKELQRMCNELIRSNQPTMSEFSELKTKCQYPLRLNWLTEQLDPAKLNGLAQSTYSVNNCLVFFASAEEHKVEHEPGTVTESTPNNSPRASLDPIENRANLGQLNSNFNNGIYTCHSEADHLISAEVNSHHKILPGQPMTVVATKQENSQKNDISNDSICWHYLRHVVIKFLLSREREVCVFGLFSFTYCKFVDFSPIR